MEISQAECLIIKAPEWFRRKDFQSFRKNKGTATFRGVDGSMEDVFVTYDNGDGSDEMLMPDDIWRSICLAAEGSAMKFGVIWIRP